MKRIDSEEEQENIRGGFNITSSLINSLVGGIKAIFELGRALGSSIVRTKEGDMCQTS